MPVRRPHAAWYVLLPVSLAVAARLGFVADARMTSRPAGGERLAGQSSPGGDGGPRTTQKISKTAAELKAEYGFQNFNGDALAVSFRMPAADFAAYEDAFGYSSAGLDEVKARRDAARKAALADAVKKHWTQSQLDSAVAIVDKEYKTKQKDYFSSRGFRLEPGGVVVVDMPGLVRKNAPRLKPLSVLFDRYAQEKKYRSPDIVGSVLSFVQTALAYKQPQNVTDGKHSGGILQPATAALWGWGDCDTKTGLLASILANWPQIKMIGVAVPEHYLMGVLLNPEKGDTALEYDGLTYVLVEPAGPAWMPPGHVGEETSVLLAGRDGYKLEPFF